VPYNVSPRIANDTSRLKSPNGLGVSDRLGELVPATDLSPRSRLGRVLDVGDSSKLAEDKGDMSTFCLSGSISRPVRKEVSVSASCADVTERNMSNSFC
jgi:hypothetical protein